MKDLQHEECEAYADHLSRRFPEILRLPRKTRERILSLGWQAHRVLQRLQRRRIARKRWREAKRRWMKAENFEPAHWTCRMSPAFWARLEAEVDPPGDADLGRCEPGSLAPRLG